MLFINWFHLRNTSAYTNFSTNHPVLPGEKSHDVLKDETSSTGELSPLFTAILHHPQYSELKAENKPHVVEDEVKFNKTDIKKIRKVYDGCSARADLHTKEASQKNFSKRKRRLSANEKAGDYGKHEPIKKKRKKSTELKTENVVPQRIGKRSNRSQDNP